MVSYRNIKNADVDVLLVELGTLDIGIQKIVNVFHDGTQYVAVYLV